MAYDFDTSGTSFKIYRSGRALSDDVQGAIRSILVEHSVFMPSMCELEFIENPDRLGESSAGISPGDDIAVYAYAAGNITGTLLFKGTVRSSEIRIDPGHGSRSVVRVFDKAHDMLSASRTLGFKQSTYSEVVKKIAKKYDLDPFIGSAVASTPTKYDLVVQANETDWDFICRLARSVGYVAYVRPYELLKQSKVKLYFGPAAAAKTAPGSATRARGFEVGDGRLITLRAMVSGGGLPQSGQAAGWDLKASQGAVTSMGVSGKAVDSASMRRSASSYSSRKAGSRMMLETVANSRAEAKALATSYAKRFGGAAVDVELLARGHPDVTVNSAIYLDGAGALEGKYTVSGVSHLFDAEELGFTTTIYCHGLEDRTLAGIQGEGAHRPMLTGVYPAIVSSIKDPAKKGRVQLMLPWLDAQFLTGWAPIVQMGAGAGTGWQMLPSPNDEVLVAFQNGQLDSPYVVGGIHAKTKGKVTAESLHKEGTPIRQVFTSKLGHQIIINDDKEKSGITIQTQGGKSCKIEMDDKKGILIVTKGDKKPVIVTTDSDVIVTTKKNAKLNAQDVSVDAKGKVNVKGKGSVTVSGQSVSVEASGSAKLKGAKVSVEASGALNLKASGAVNIKGSAVNLN